MLIIDGGIRKEKGVKDHFLHRAVFTVHSNTGIGEVALW
jgi:hypothetical protein